MSDGNRIEGSIVGAFSTTIWILLILSICFLFTGEPDLWDKWHAKAMGESCVVVEN